MSEPLDVDVVTTGLRFPEGPGGPAGRQRAAGRDRPGHAERACGPTAPSRSWPSAAAGPNGAAIGPDGAVWLCNNGGFFTWHQISDDLAGAGRDARRVAGRQHPAGRPGRRVGRDGGHRVRRPAAAGPQRPGLRPRRRAVVHRPRRDRHRGAPTRPACCYRSPDGTVSRRGPRHRVHERHRPVARRATGCTWPRPTPAGCGPGTWSAPGQLAAIRPATRPTAARCCTTRPRVTCSTRWPSTATGWVCVATLGQGGITCVAPDGSTVRAPHPARPAGHQHLLRWRATGAPPSSPRRGAASCFDCRWSRPGLAPGLRLSRATASCSPTSTTCSATASAAGSRPRSSRTTSSGRRPASCPARCSPRRARHGFLGMAVPEEFGGGGRRRLPLQPGHHRGGAGRRAWPARASASPCTTTSACPTSCATAPTSSGSGGCRASPSGELITAIAMTEPGIGSDLASMATTAVRDGDHYVVNGSKTFITNGINADLVITAVKTDPTPAPPGHEPAGARAGHGRLRARTQPRQDRPARPGHRRAVLLRRRASRSTTCWATRARASPSWWPTCPRSGCRSRPPAWPRPAAALGWTARLRQGSARPSASRSAPSRTPASSWPRWRTEVEMAQSFVDRCVLGAQRGRAHRRGGGHGQVVVHRAAEAGRRPAASSSSAATAT